MALLALAGQGIAAALGGAALGGGLAFLLLRPLVALRPAARWSERMVTHAATFRALADTRIWFFRRLADRLPGGIGLRPFGRPAGAAGLRRRFARRALSAGAGAGVLGAGRGAGGRARCWPAPRCWRRSSPLPLAVALLLPLLLAPGAARAAAQAAAAQGRLRAAAVDPLLGVEDVLAANARAGRRRHPGARRPRRWRGRSGGLGWRAAWAGAAGTLLVQAALLGALAWGLSAGAEGAALAVLGAVPRGRLGGSRSACCRAPASRWPAPRPGRGGCSSWPMRRRRSPSPATPAAEPTGHAIRVEGLHFAWTPDRAAVFDGLDLDIPEGARLALLGPSGIGKSSLVALLLKLAAPQAGRISFGGVDIADAAGRIRAPRGSPA